MKTTKTILTALLILVMGVSKAQNEKVITAVLKDFGEACGQDPGDAIFCLTDEKGKVITERYTCNMTDGAWKVEPKDLITSEWALNPKYKGKTAKLYCKPGTGGGWFVEKVEFVSSSAQTSDNAAKTLTVTGTVTIGQKGMGCTISIQDGAANTVTLSLGKLKAERSKYFQGYCKLNPAYEGKKFIITYTTRTYAAGEGMFTANDLVDLKLEKETPVTFEKDNFSTATCRAYNVFGQLIAVMDNNVIYPIKDGKKDEKEARPIQNKDEVCLKGNKCTKVKVEADGLVNIFYLPNITDATPACRIVGDKIYRTQKKNTDIDEYKEFYYFKGNKAHIALISVVTRLGMGN